MAEYSGECLQWACVSIPSGETVDRALGFLQGLLLLTLDFSNMFICEFSANYASSCTHWPVPSGEVLWAIHMVVSRDSCGVGLQTRHRKDAQTGSEAFGWVNMKGGPKRSPPKSGTCLILPFLKWCLQDVQKWNKHNPNPNPYLLVFGSVHL